MCWTGTGRTREAALFRAVTRQLVRHVGGRPSAAEELLIGRVAWLSVHLAAIDQRAMKDGGLSPHATREYLAWHNTIARTLARLGMKGAAPKPQTLAALIAEADAAAPKRAPSAPPPAG